MKERSLLLSKWVLATTLVWSLAASAADQPNIIFVVTDDLGWGDIQTYNANGQVDFGDPTLERTLTEIGA